VRGKHRYSLYKKERLIKEKNVERALSEGNTLGVLLIKKKLAVSKGIRTGWAKTGKVVQEKREALPIHLGPQVNLELLSVGGRTRGGTGAIKWDEKGGQGENRGIKGGERNYTRRQFLVRNKRRKN